MHESIHKYKDIHIDVCIYNYVCFVIFVYVLAYNKYVCMYPASNRCMYVHAYVCLHTYMNKYIHSYACTYRLMFVFQYT